MIISACLTGNIGSLVQILLKFVETFRSINSPNTTPLCCKHSKKHEFYAIVILIGECDA